MPSKGRPKGSPNRATASRERTLEQGGALPRDFLLKVMRDESEEKHVRIDAAKAVAPYVHPRLSQVDAHHTGQLDIRAWLQKLGEPD